MATAGGLTSTERLLPCSSPPCLRLTLTALPTLPCPPEVNIVRSIVPCNEFGHQPGGHCAGQSTRRLYILLLAAQSAIRARGSDAAVPPEFRQVGLAEHVPRYICMYITRGNYVVHKGSASVIGTVHIASVDKVQGPDSSVHLSVGAYISIVHEIYLVYFVGKFTMQQTRHRQRPLECRPVYFVLRIRRRRKGWRGKREKEGPMTRHDVRHAQTMWVSPTRDPGTKYNVYVQVVRHQLSCACRTCFACLQL